MSRLRALLAFTLHALCCTSLATGYSFRGLGFVGNGLPASAANSVSSDASAVGGTIRTTQGTYGGYSRSGGGFVEVPVPSGIQWNSSIVTACTPALLFGYGVGPTGLSGTITAQSFLYDPR